jgi:hypothetical protein
MGSLLPIERTLARSIDRARAAKSSDDERFVRLHWEIPQPIVKRERRWVPFAKGGDFSPYYVEIPTVVDWLDDGAQSWAFYEANSSRTGGMVKNPQFYFRPGHYVDSSLPLVRATGIAGRLHILCQELLRLHASRRDVEYNRCVQQCDL